MKKFSEILYIIPRGFSKFIKKSIEVAESVELQQMRDSARKLKEYGDRPEPTPAPTCKTESISEWASRHSRPQSFIDFQTTLYKQFIGRLDRMKHEEITIKIVNNGFYVKVGCQDFVFTSEKELFQAISEYKKDPEKAGNKYRRKGE